MKKLPTLSDGKRRYVTAKEYARLEAMAKAAGKPLREWLELFGPMDKRAARKEFLESGGGLPVKQSGSDNYKPPY